MLNIVALFSLLALAVAARTALRPPRFHSQSEIAGKNSWSSLVGRALPTIAVVTTASPALVRPLLQGDSLGYHLPNAAAWSTTHTIFTTGTTYWWYPGGSELFAAGLFTASGPYSIGLSGTVAALLLAHRLYAFARKATFGSLFSGSFSAAFVSMGIVALQAASLENDVWLATFLLEVVWAIRYDAGAVGRSLGLCALIKPYGFLFALLAVGFGRAAWRSVLLGLLPLAIWVARDTMLWRDATIDPATTAVPNLAGTTIIGQGLVGFTTLVSAIAAQGPALILASLAVIITLLFSRDSLIRYLALGTALFFIVEPFGFRNDIPQLATGASLRFALPAFVTGLIGVLPMLRRMEALIPILLLFTVVNIHGVASIFTNDATTHGVYFVALTIAVLSTLPWDKARRLMIAMMGLGLIVYARQLTASHRSII